MTHENRTKDAHNCIFNLQLILKSTTIRKKAVRNANKCLSEELQATKNLVLSLKTYAFITLRSFVSLSMLALFHCDRVS
jgi:hypothetical protein